MHCSRSRCTVCCNVTRFKGHRGTVLSKFFFIQVNENGMDMLLVLVLSLVTKTQCLIEIDSVVCSLYVTIYIYIVLLVIVNQSKSTLSDDELRLLLPHSILVVTRWN